MADRELIAAILTSGMLPTVPVPRSRAEGRSGPVTDAEGETIQAPWAMRWAYTEPS
jgi:hypothetical protein